MPDKAPFITHRFGGGWATDYGPQFYGAPDQAGQMVVPFLVNAKNVTYELDGGPHKAPGVTKYNASVINSSTTTISGFYDYWKLGTGGTPTQKVVAFANGNLYADAANGVFASVKAGLTSGAVPHFSTFNDLLIFADDNTADVPQQYDQTTAGNLTGSPPRFSFSVKHKNKHWAAGDWSKPYRLYYSVDNNPQDWTNAGSGSIDIDPGDGDMITAIYSYKNDLWVFKGPNKCSIHRITGSSPTGADAYARTVFIQGISAAWQNLVFPMGDDLGFVSPWGTVHTINATAAFGNYYQGTMSFPIGSYVRSNLNNAKLRIGQAVDAPELGRVLISLPSGSSTKNNIALMMDYRFGVDPPNLYPRWALWDAFSWASVARVLDTSVTNQNRPVTFVGGYDGTIYKANSTTKSNNGSSINMQVTLPYLTYGNEIQMKHLERASVGILPWSTQNMTFGYQMDNNAQQQVTLAQGGADTLG